MQGERYVVVIVVFNPYIIYELSIRFCGAVDFTTSHLGSSSLKTHYNFICSLFCLQLTKFLMRGELAEDWKAYLIPESESAWKQLSSPGTVAKLKGVMDRLSGKKATSKL